MDPGVNDRRKYEQHLAILRGQFDQEAIETLSSEGHSITLKEIIDDLMDWQAIWCDQTEPIIWPLLR